MLPAHGNVTYHWWEHTTTSAQRCDAGRERDWQSAKENGKHNAPKAVSGWTAVRTMWSDWWNNDQYHMATRMRRIEDQQRRESRRHICVVLRRPGHAEARQDDGL